MKGIPGGYLQRMAFDKLRLSGSCSLILEGMIANSTHIRSA
jgi:hypothetical protein